jgi:hypothetical protein
MAFSTKTLAALTGLEANTIRLRLYLTGSYFGIVPTKMVNGRLAWPDDSFERLKKKRKLAAASKVDANVVA